jgi:hypothetical protein
MTQEVAKRSGPKTDEGKEISSRNATRHAMLSHRPVVEGIEREEDWLEYREGVLGDLDPQGYLESVLAEQVASLLWRRNRITRYEAEATAPLQEEAEKKIYKLRRLEEARSRACVAESLPTLSDDEFVPVKEALAVFFHSVDLLTEDHMHGVDLEAIPLPDISAGASQSEPRWTAGGFREAIAVLAEQTGLKPEQLLAWAEGIPHLGVKEAEREAEWDKLEVSGCPAERERVWGKRILPDEKAIERIVRYEAHLGRELNRTLEQLKALQITRKAQAGGDR